MLHELSIKSHFGPSMKRSSVLLLFLLFVQLSFSGTGNSQQLETTEVDGGSVYQIKSTLHRKWIVFNQVPCPLRLERAGINTPLELGKTSDEYSFKPSGSIRFQSGVKAFEIRFILYNVWGERIKTLIGTKIEDWEQGDEIKDLSAELGGWGIHDSGITSYVTCISFVARAITADGRIWRANIDEIVKGIAQLELESYNDVTLPSGRDPQITDKKQ